MVDIEITERRVRVGNVELNVAETGTGSPVLLLHGWPDSWHLWREQMRALAERGHRVIAPDLRGFGQSDHPEGVEAYSLATIVGDVVGILDEFEVERAAVVGHDFGAALSWLFATFQPERVERLAAISVGHPKSFTGAGLPQKQLSWYMLWFQFPGVAEVGLAENDWELFRDWAHGGAPRGSDEYMERQINDLSRPGRLTSGFNWYRANISTKNFAGDGRGIDLPMVTCPTMGVWSSGDMALGETQMTGSAKFVAGPWRYERLEDVGHWIPVYASDALNGLLEDFLGP